MKGPAAVATFIGLEQIAEKKVAAVFDELHKYRRWKIALKGFFDTARTLLSQLL